jgi:hypothetical protein
MGGESGGVRPLELVRHTIGEKWINWTDIREKRHGTRVFVPTERRGCNWK